MKEHKIKEKLEEEMHFLYWSEKNSASFIKNLEEQERENKKRYPGFSLGRIALVMLVLVLLLGGAMAISQ
ncbi:MAG: hypothetical protein GX786_03475, partial [Clostridiales bacterium]|nr:hypothetical protein [Clostridiales bacterium]